MCWIIGVNYRGTGEAAKGVPFLERAVELRQQVLGADHPDTLSAKNSLGLAYESAGKFDQALPLLEQTLKLAKAARAPTIPIPSTTWPAWRRPTGPPASWTRPCRSSRRRSSSKKAKLGPDHPKTLNSMNNLALGYSDAGKLDKALPLFEETLTLRKAKNGPDHPSSPA